MLSVHDDAYDGEPQRLEPEDYSPEHLAELDLLKHVTAILALLETMPAGQQDDICGLEGLEFACRVVMADLGW